MKSAGLLSEPGAFVSFGWPPRGTGTAQRGRLLSSPCRPFRRRRRVREDRRPAAGFSFSGSLGDHRFGGQEQAGDGRGVLERAAGHLGGIDDAGLDEVFVLAGGDVVAFVALALLDFLRR